MQIQRLDHFTLRTPRLDETRAFFETVAGLTAGERPAFAFPGAWMYAKSVAVVHLAVFDPNDKALSAYLGEGSGGSGSGIVDHLAFRCTGLPAFEDRLRNLGVTYVPRTVPALREHQVFVIDPNQIRVEFIFDASEPASWCTDADGVAIATREME